MNETNIKEKKIKKRSECFEINTYFVFYYKKIV